MDFRKANSSDVPALMQFRKQQLLEEGLPPGTDPAVTIDGELTEYFTSGLADGSFIAWLAADQEAVIASSGLCFYQLPPTFHNPTGKVAYITNMYTLPAYRKQGIASRLFELLLDEARAREYSIVRLHASKDGRNIYAKAGFTDSDGYMTMRLKGNR
ncbi:MAG: GNAT family N-acetyltransferase [Oscillospiraceae bacterium]|nr:GNAT family N-acetyltransferase [Oscillospiraceae bacterium]